jgi:hypothetical protein
MMRMRIMDADEDEDVRYHHLHGLRSRSTWIGWAGKTVGARAARLNGGQATQRLAGWLGRRAA